jgi:phosphate:Na+ symporter
MPDALMSVLGPLAGGLGLFLLGMSMMTDGLKLAAGPALERILIAATHTRWHALGSGLLVTALVQASGAVTVATIGFVNAGLLGLGPALWLLFGSNVGTTTTGWIVALIGLKFDIEALALPLIGVGVVMRLTGEGSRRGALGTALAGFGLLFFGIALLQEAFGGLAGQIRLPQGEGALSVLAQVAVGALMTVAMQSSSAAIVITLTATQGGLLSVQGAAAVVIGANIGTTFTAALAAVGATPNARRAAAAHVIFNVLTGAVALALLPWMIGVLSAAREALGMAPDPAAKLALFHTIFNVLGVLIMLPLAAPLTRWLERRFRRAEEDEARPQHLDRTLLGVPSLALQALDRELRRLAALTQRMVASAIDGAAAVTLARDRLIVDRLGDTIADFIVQLHRTGMSQKSAERLPELLRVARYCETAATLAQQAAGTRAVAPTAGEARFRATAHALLAALDPAQPPADADVPEALMADFENAYQAQKATLLNEAASGDRSVAEADAALLRASELRRALQQLHRGHRRLETVSPGTATAPAPDRA